VITNMTLQERKEAFKANLSQYKARIMICAGTGCVANGSLKVYDEFVKKIINIVGCTDYSIFCHNFIFSLCEYFL
jgi:NADH:ubiquinone oxidoreductase subunit E